MGTENEKFTMCKLSLLKLYIDRRGTAENFIRLTETTQDLLEPISTKQQKILTIHANMLRPIYITWK